MAERATKQVSPAARGRSVKVEPPTPPPGAPPSASFDSSLMWMVAQAADEMSPWGVSPRYRDAQLRKFFPTESYFTSALGTVVSRNMGFSWVLHGSEAVVEAQQDMLNNANNGEGWHDFIAKVSMDLYTQDQGAFIEIVRAFDSPEAPVIGINHLDAEKCYHSGNSEFPVYYQDANKIYHRLAWYEAVTLSELPTPIESLPGLQLCALTRMLRAAQVIRNVTIYKEEKTGGRNARALHMIQGLTTKQITDAVKKLEAYADAQGLLRYMQPLIVGTRDPEAKIDLKTLELATMPDGWDEEKQIKLYIAIIAMAFLGDYQDFAPLPGGNLGTSAQSETLHMKSRGKGAGLFRKRIAHMLNHKILPKVVTFEFEEQDIVAEQEEAEVQKTRAETRKFQIESGELTVMGARQIAVDSGDIPQEVFDLMGEEDVTQDVTAPDEAAPPKPETVPKPDERLEDEEPTSTAKAKGDGVPIKAGPFRERLRRGLSTAIAEDEAGAFPYWQ